MSCITAQHKTCRNHYTENMNVKHPVCSQALQNKLNSINLSLTNGTDFYYHTLNFDTFVLIFCVFLFYQAQTLKFHHKQIRKHDPNLDRATNTSDVYIIHAVHIVPVHKSIAAPAQAVLHPEPASTLHQSVKSVGFFRTCGIFYYY